MLTLLLAFSLGAAARDRGPGCPPPASAPAGTAFVVTSETEMRDTTVTVRICLATPAGRRIGSYHGELAFPAAEARVLRVERPNEGMRVENSNAPGAVSFAGAIPNGLGTGELLTVRLRSTIPGRSLVTRLRLIELNDLGGTSLLGDTRVNGAATEVAATVDEKPCSRRAATAPPLLQGLEPAMALISGGEPVIVTVRGCGFGPTGNIVTVGPARLTDVPSLDRGTRLRFAVPQTATGGGEVAPMTMPLGRVQVTVSTSRGRSNALPLTLR
jgi:hypothetical protein